MIRTSARRRLFGSSAAGISRSHDSHSAALRRRGAALEWIISASNNLLVMIGSVRSKRVEIEMSPELLSLADALSLYQYTRILGPLDLPFFCLILCLFAMQSIRFDSIRTIIASMIDRPLARNQ